MTIILLTILGAIVSAFFNSLFDRMFREYNPDTKKLISIAKKSLLFIFRYILPIVYIILAFIFIDFNKVFVLVISINITVIAVNVVADSIKNISVFLGKLILSLNDNNVKKTPEQIEKIIFELNHNVKKIDKQINDSDN